MKLFSHLRSLGRRSLRSAPGSAPGWLWRIARTGVVGVMLLTSGPALAQISGNAGTAVTIQAAEINRFLAENLRHTRLPGVAVAVVNKDGSTYFAAAGATSAGGPVDRDTPFRVASVSKSFTAFAVMLLVDRGLIDLDTPVTDYLSDFSPADDRAKAITVRHLLTHTSGMADTGFAEMSRPQPASLAEAVTRLDSARLVAPPGAQWNYHNPNYHVLARLVEVVSGRDFAAFLKEEIFRPAGMNHTSSVSRSTDPAPGLGKGYAPVYGVMVARDIPDHFIAGSGGVVSTTGDMARWLSMQLNDGVTREGLRLISSASLELAQNQSLPSAGVGGFGWGASTHPDLGRKIDHGGVLFTYSSQQMLYPDRDIAVIVLFNSVTTGGAEQGSFISGVEAILTGQTPVFGRPIGLFIDLVLAMVSAASALIGVFNIRRASRWAAWWSNRSPVLTGARLIVGALPVALLAGLPFGIGFLFGGRDVTWETLVFAWPALFALFAVPAVFSIFTLGARGNALARLRSTGSPDLPD